ncbi:Uncharacterised protein [uncultured archaeon]|nr:Uncharacterised protein [uncultured archaeon]
MPEKRITPKNKDVLIICVDRDDDFGRKAGIKGPIIGRQASIDAATSLAVKDPSESDVNAVFQAVKVYDDLRSENKVEVVILIGDEKVGIDSDRKILAQLDEVLKTLSFKEAVLISDGAEDEHVLPVLKSKIDVIYTQRVIVKQSERLETTYYMINDFVKDTLSDKKTAHIFFGIPAFALLLYALFGAPAWRLIFGVVGAYLFIKGFFLESYIYEAINEITASAVKERRSFFLYISSIAAAIIALFMGYAATLSQEGILEEVLLFVKSSSFAWFVALTLALVGRLLILGKEALPRYITYVILSFAAAWIAYEVTLFGLGTSIGYNSIIYATMFSGAMVAISTAVERYVALKRKRK